MKLKLGIVAALLCFPFLSYADECVLSSGGVKKGNEFIGATTCSKVTESDIKVTGPFSLEKSTIAKVNVKGPSTANNATVAHFTVMGPLTLSESKVDQLTLIGTLNANDSAIADIIVTGNLVLVDSKVGNIIVKKNPNISKIYLKGDTEVKGNITFKGGNGVIYQEKNARILGKVDGGKVETSEK